MQQIVYYAHSSQDLPYQDWDRLDQHLFRVARCSSQFAEAFGGGEWGYCAGLWHDLGKYRPEFQQRLLGSKEPAEHSGAGAALAVLKSKEFGTLLAFVIAGHHAGLANYASSETSPRPLKERLRENEQILQEIRTSVPVEIADHPLPQLPEFLRGQVNMTRKESQELCRKSELWTRFLFSALVDADRLDTEAFYDPMKTTRRSSFSSINVLRQSLDSYIDRDIAKPFDPQKSSQLNVARARILESCRAAISREPGIFSLTVPTGGGKTLAGMSFALGHAEHWGHRRVVVVLPYTSIIEQNADVYRKALGPDQVVEHHSAFDSEEARAMHGQELTSKHDLACENWDAPVIVTTTVQFFESLFSNHPSRCRKLHNLVRSVVILDEVQALPPGYLLSILEALNELAEHYGCTVVLSTATPPALAAREKFPGLRNVREIVADPNDLAKKLKRVEYVWPDAEAPPMAWSELATRVTEHQQVLTVVHKRNDARNFAKELREIDPDTPVFHLSALMCAAHRSVVLAEIKSQLGQGSRCYVVSTQLVEAGVDIDFPAVFRALGGLDSIVQAAGRCNREGRLEKGRVIIFKTETSPPPGTPRQALEATEGLLQEMGGELDPSNPELFERYFRNLYFVKDLDAKGIQTLRQGFNFASVGQEFRLIEDGFTKSVVVPYGDGVEHLERLRAEGPNRSTLRSLQRYIVTIYPSAFDAFVNAGALEEIKSHGKVIEGIFGLTKPFEHCYDKTFGLVTGDEPQADPAQLVVSDGG